MGVIDCVADLAWKLVPFRQGNRIWVVDLYKAYVACLLVGTFLAVTLNLLEGDIWLGKSGHQMKGILKSKGESALDECLWYIFCNMHGVGMNDFMPHSTAGRLIGMMVTAFSYWFPIYMMAIVVLSQLPGEKALGAAGTAERLLLAVWPSYAFLLGATCAVGSLMGPYVSDDPAGVNEWPTGIYWLWTVVHRQPYGDIYPDTPFGRLVTVPAAWAGMMYMPYALATVAVRKPSPEEHEMLLDYLRNRPEDVLGRGYVIPETRPTSGGNAREMAFITAQTD